MNFVGCEELVLLHTQINSNIYLNRMLKTLSWEGMVNAWYQKKHEHNDLIIVICYLDGLLKICASYVSSSSKVFT